MHHPFDREYTFCSHAHKSLSRIDYLVATEQTLASVEKPRVEDMVIFDHSPISLQYSIHLLQGDVRLWQFLSYLAGN